MSALCQDILVDAPRRGSIATRLQLPRPSRTTALAWQSSSTANSAHDMLLFGKCILSLGRVPLHDPHKTSISELYIAKFEAPMLHSL